MKLREVKPLLEVKGVYERQRKQDSAKSPGAHSEYQVIHGGSALCTGSLQKSLSIWSSKILMKFTVRATVEKL